MNAVRYVAQPNGYGCSIACVAMVVGMTYEQTETWFLARGLARERMKRGLWDGIWLEALGRLGFSYVQRYRCNPLTNSPRDEWPCAPFAPIHICTADVVAGHHAIVMLADGTVLDPFKSERTSLAHADYRQIDQIIGVYQAEGSGA